MFYTEVPREDPKLHDQKELSDMSDQDFHALFEPTKPSMPMRIYRLLCFILFLAPLKILIVVFFGLIFSVVVSVLPYFRRFFGTSRSFKHWCFQVCRPLIRMVLFGLGIMKLNVNGMIDQDARTIVANHVSLVEAILLLDQFPCSYLAAALLERSKILRNLSRVFDVLFVDRTRSQNVSQQICDIANDPTLLPVVIFPEGKITNGDALVGFRSGAYISETLVQPVAIRYRMWFTPRTMSTIAWNEENLKMYLYQAFAIPFMTVDIDVLPPLKWKGEQKSPREKAAESELQIANFLGTLACSRTNKDVKMNEKKEKRD